MRTPTRFPPAQIPPPHRPTGHAAAPPPPRSRQPKRREWDSNPRGSRPRLFKSLAFGRSAIPPANEKLPAHETSQRRDPLVGSPPRRLRVTADGLTVLARCRIRAEELQRLELGVQVAQAVGDHLVVDVTLEVDDEAVLPQAPLGRP